MDSSKNEFDQMSQERWGSICTEVTNLMRVYIESYVTSISRVIEHSYGEHLGSGSFLLDDGSLYLITNEHVARELQSTSLAYKLFNSDDVLRVVNPFCSVEYPLDVAVSMISEKAWSAYKHDTKGIPLTKLSVNHQPVLGELLFITGYSGEYSSFHYETLITRATPYLTQEVELPIGYGDPAYHFAIDYRPDLAISTVGTSRGLPTPPGLSGSLVWNTRYIECAQKRKEWGPDKAEVTGIIWGWPSSDACLIATKVEHLSIRDLVDAAKSLAKN